MKIYVFEIGYVWGINNISKPIGFFSSYEEAHAVADPLFPGGTWEQMNGYHVLSHGPKVVGGYYPVTANGAYYPVYHASIQEHELGEYDASFQPGTEADRNNPALFNSGVGKQPRESKQA